MRKIQEIITIIMSTVLTLVSLIELIPIESEFGKKVIYFLQKISENHVASVIILFFVLLFSCIAIYKAIVDIKDDRKVHSFKLGSKKFVKYFSKWYSKQGNKNIICSDMAWTVTKDDNTEIFDTLIKCSKDNTLTLFVKKSENGKYDQFTEELRSAGAKVKEAPEAIVNGYTYSTISYMGTVNSIIVRNKTIPTSGRIVFEEISNNYISGIFTALLEISREEGACERT